MSPEEQRMLKVGSLYVPMVMVVSMILAAIYFTFVVSTERAKIYSEINSVKQSIHILTTNLNKFIEATGEGRFTKERYINECLRQQILNPNWKCRYASEWKARVE